MYGDDLTNDQEVVTQALPSAGYAEYACTGTDANGERQAGTMCQAAASKGCKKAYKCTQLEDDLKQLPGMPEAEFENLKAVILSDVEEGTKLLRKSRNTYGE